MRSRSVSLCGATLFASAAVAASGVRLLGVAILDDRGAPRYHKAVAENVVAAGMPVAALSPEALARGVGEQVR